jgi:hypothetical protein
VDVAAGKAAVVLAGAAVVDVAAGKAAVVLLGVSVIAHCNAQYGQWVSTGFTVVPFRENCSSRERSCGYFSSAEATTRPLSRLVLGN